MSFLRKQEARLLCACSCVPAGQAGTVGYFLDCRFRGGDTPQPASLSTVLSLGRREAGLRSRPGEGEKRRRLSTYFPLYVIPTKVGIQLFLSWIPAYAGMTHRAGLSTARGEGKRMPPHSAK